MIKPIPGVSDEDAASLSRFQRHVLRLKKRGVCVRCRDHWIDELYSVCHCPPCLVQVRETTRKKHNSKARFGGISKDDAIFLADKALAERGSPRDKGSGKV